MKKKLGEKLGVENPIHENAESRRVSILYCKKNLELLGLFQFLENRKIEKSEIEIDEKMLMTFLGKGQSVRMYSVRARQKVKN
jgi:hypothetical protein